MHSTIKRVLTFSVKIRFRRPTDKLETRRERLKSAPYLRLKKRKVFETCPERIYEELRKQFRDTQRVPFMLDKTRKPLVLQLGTKKNIFEEIRRFALGLPRPDLA